jgi:hypothetical protein
MASTAVSTDPCAVSSTIVMSGAVLLERAQEVEAARDSA